MMINSKHAPHNEEIKRQKVENHLPSFRFKKEV